MITMNAIETIVALVTEANVTRKDGATIATMGYRFEDGEAVWGPDDDTLFWGYDKDNRLYLSIPVRMKILDYANENFLPSVTEKDSTFNIYQTFSILTQSNSDHITIGGPAADLMDEDEVLGAGCYTYDGIIKLLVGATVSYNSDTGETLLVQMTLRTPS